MKDIEINKSKESLLKIEKGLKVDLDIRIKELKKLMARNKELDANNQRLTKEIKQLKEQFINKKIPKGNIIQLSNSI